MSAIDWVVFSGLVLLGLGLAYKSFTCSKSYGHSETLVFIETADSARDLRISMQAIFDNGHSPTKTNLMRLSQNQRDGKGIFDASCSECGQSLGDSVLVCNPLVRLTGGEITLHPLQVSSEEKEQQQSKINALRQQKEIERRAAQSIFNQSKDHDTNRNS